MTTNARKTDAQRLGNGKKAFNIKQIEEKIDNLPSTEDVEEMLETKQDVLTAGENITIVDNVISATGGSSGEWTLVPISDYNTIYDSETKTIKKDIIVTLYAWCAESNYGVTVNASLFLKKDKVVNSAESVSGVNVSSYNNGSTIYKAEASCNLRQIFTLESPTSVPTLTFALYTLGTTSSASFSLNKVQKLNSSNDYKVEIYTKD